MTDVIYTGAWPDDVRAIVEPALTPFLHLVPGWCRSLYVRFQAGEANDSAGISMDYEYRHAVLFVRPGWLEEMPEDRDKALIHEIAHLHVQPMRTVFVDLCDKGIQDQAFRDFAWERFKEAWEGAVEDLAWALHAARSGAPE